MKCTYFFCVLLWLPFKVRTLWDGQLWYVGLLLTELHRTNVSAKATIVTFSAPRGGGGGGGGSKKWSAVWRLFWGEAKTSSGAVPEFLLLRRCCVTKLLLHPKHCCPPPSLPFPYRRSRPEAASAAHPAEALRWTLIAD